jgi:hypothetical protein
MIRIIANPAVQSTLEGVMETVELRGSDGELLGYFSPASPEAARLYAKAAALLDREQLGQRRTTSHSTHSTDEVLAHLQSDARR